MSGLQRAERDREVERRNAPSSLPLSVSTPLGRSHATLTTACVAKSVKLFGYSFFEAALQAGSEQGSR